MACMIDAGNLLPQSSPVMTSIVACSSSTPAASRSTPRRRTPRACCFGDDSTLGDLPSLKVGYNVRHFAAVTGDGHLQWYFERMCEQARGTENEFYNYGWWSFAFDDLQYRHDWPQVSAVEPGDLPLMRHFKDVGWVAVQRQLTTPTSICSSSPRPAATDRSATAMATRVPSCCSPTARSWPSRVATTSVSTPACTASGVV